MIVCGLKLTHDGAVALLHGDKLVFSIEMEKLGNGARYSPVADLDVVPKLLADYGYRISDVDQWIIDGWDGSKHGIAELSNDGTPVTIRVAPYRENDAVPDLLTPGYTGKFRIGDEVLPYTSFLHVTGHLVSAYCSSDFAKRGEPSFVLVWDGGMFPRLYFVDPDTGVSNGGELFPLIGHGYATAAHHFGPFRRHDESRTVDDLSVAGKLMAYIALGTPRPDVLRVLAELFDEHFEADTPKAQAYRTAIGGWGSNSEPSLHYVHAFFRDVRTRVDELGANDEDVLASVHTFLEGLLVERITEKVTRWKGDGPWNLCFIGGCALNIKWNSALRALPVFAGVWVPPFPNDSGSAIGTASAGLAGQFGLRAIDWHPRSGPALVPTGKVPEGWDVSPCTPAELAAILHETGRPVVLLNGRAELGPRALGGRSIIAPATDPGMKDELNRVKFRESYRPVAPICLTEFAPDIFSPGTPDPHMLFDHRVRPDWVDRVPAILHLDGTARLQTVSTGDDPTLEAILRAYYLLSGIPVLCNTSANLNGSGFFPDVDSALAWGRVGLVWSEGTLYRRTAVEAASV
ncbi:nodulation protein U [Saccharothrix sp. 6-C]|uniref:carbamoyltransferase N-terminal domain-containing protein n=1 Tax=Saccharothrix sp. 6-C TaxID=2781735 RepID=UPI001916FE8F|nr:carbamoyltransferase N-terminal domain-containing protein [Saccharothrix sp. 6-C]QQQ78803.1 nodulation protein U [Saccharothrix sp. 6-C]